MAAKEKSSRSKAQQTADCSRPTSVAQPLSAHLSFVPTLLLLSLHSSLHSPHITHRYGHPTPHSAPCPPAVLEYLFLPRCFDWLWIPSLSDTTRSPSSVMTFIAVPSPSNIVSIPLRATALSRHLCYSRQHPNTVVSTRVHLPRQQLLPSIYLDHPSKFQYGAVEKRPVERTNGQGQSSEPRRQKRWGSRTLQVAGY
jgi:hypothetical protein